MQQHPTKTKNKTKKNPQNSKNSSEGNTSPLATAEQTPLITILQLIYRVLLLILQIQLRMAAKSVPEADLRSYRRVADELPTAAALQNKGQGGEIAVPPQTVGVPWVLKHLDIPRSNFYRNVFNKLLYPALTIGRRSYFLIEEVHALKQSTEKGAHIFSKLAREAASSRSKT